THTTAPHTPRKSTSTTASAASAFKTCSGGALELPQAIEGAPLALGGPAGAGDARGWRSPPRARRIRRSEILVECAGDRGRAAAVVERGHLEDAPAPLGQRDAEEVAAAQRLGRLGRLVVGVELAAVP